MKSKTLNVKETQRTIYQMFKKKNDTNSKSQNAILQPLKLKIKKKKKEQAYIHQSLIRIGVCNGLSFNQFRGTFTHSIALFVVSKVVAVIKVCMYLK